MDSHLRILVLGLASLLIFAACSPADESPEPRPLTRVASTIPPLHGLVRPLLPDGFDCRSIIAPGEAVHGHRVSPEEVAVARRADVVFAVGLGLDAGVLRPLLENPTRGQQVVVFADLLGLEGEGHCDEEHGDTHDHAVGAATHLWLNPGDAGQFVRGASEALMARARASQDEALATEIQARSQRWLARIEAVDAAYRERLGPYAGRVVLTAHPAFGGLLGRYGLGELSVSPLSPHSTPTPAQLAEAVRFALDQGAAAVFTEPLAPRGAAEMVAQRAGLPLGVLDPLGSGDWEATMMANLDALVAALSAGAPAPEPTP